MTVKSPWVNRDFGIFWFVQSLSMLGNSMSLVALPVLVLQATGSVAQMGLLTAVAGIASIAAGLFAGRLVDRWHRRRIMIGCDAVRVVLLGAIPVSWLWGAHVWVLYVVIALASVCDMVFRIAYVPAVANLVDRSQIVAATGRLETTYAVAYIVGPLLAGVLSGSFGPSVAVALDAVTFALSSAGMVAVRLREREGAPVETAAPNGRERLRSGFLQGAAFLWKNPVMRWTVILLATGAFLSLGLTDVFIYEVRDELHQGDRAVGYALGLSSVGAIVGASATARLRKWWGPGGCLLRSYLLCGLAPIVVGMSRDLVVVIGMAALFSTGTTVAGVCSVSLLQEVTPDHLLGRATSVFWTVQSALGPLGAASLTAVVGEVGLAGPLIVVGAIFLIVVAVGALTPIAHRAPDSAEVVVTPF